MKYSTDEKNGLTKIVSLLKSHQTEYLSGQDLSDVLKISRVAIWKNIQKLEKLGYEISTEKNHGYKLISTTDQLLPWEIVDGLKTKKIGHKVQYFEKIDSTQNFALDIAKNAHDGTIVIAKNQTKGKGRIGKKWISPPGGIWLSIILKPTIDITIASLIPMSTSLALVLAIEKTLKIKPKLRWPNDVIINGKKVAGVIVDVSVKSNEIESIVLGIGINFQINPKIVSKKFENSKKFYGATSLIKNNSLKPLVLLQSFLIELEKVLKKLESGKTKDIISDWTKRSSTIGKKATVEISGKKITGHAIKLDYDGALIIKQKNQSQRVITGEIINIR